MSSVDEILAGARAEVDRLRDIVDRKKLALETFKVTRRLAAIEDLASSQASGTTPPTEELPPGFVEAGLSVDRIKTILGVKKESVVPTGIGGGVEATPPAPPVAGGVGGGMGQIAQAPPTPVAAPAPAPAPVQDDLGWTKVFNVSPQTIQANGTKAPETDWILLQAKGTSGAPQDLSQYQRFTGSNGTVAYAWTFNRDASKTGENDVGMPMLTSAGGGRIIVLPWNPNVYQYQGQYFDLLSFTLGKRSPV